MIQGPRVAPAWSQEGPGESGRNLKVGNSTASDNPPTGISQRIKGTRKSWSNKAFEKNVGLHFYFMQGCIP